MRSCGSRFPTRMPRSKSIHSVLNAAPVGSSALPRSVPPRSVRASGSQSFVVGFFFMRCKCARAGRFPQCQGLPQCQRLAARAALS